MGYLSSPILVPITWKFPGEWLTLSQQWKPGYSGSHASSNRINARKRASEQQGRAQKANHLFLLSSFLSQPLLGNAAHSLGVSSYIKTIRTVL